VQATAEATDQADQLLRELPGFVRSDWVIGESFPPVYYNQIVGEDGTAHFAQAAVTVSDAATARSHVVQLQRRLSEKIPDAEILVAPFAQGPPVQADVEFRLIGPSDEVLRQLGAQIRRELAEHPDILLARVSLPGGEPKWRFVLQEDSARQAGFLPADLAGILQAKLDGLVAASFIEGTEQIPVRVRLRPDQRSGLPDLKATLLPLPGSREWVPLDALGSLQLIPEAASITRRNSERVNRVFGYSRPGSLPLEIVREVSDSLTEKGFSLPVGYRLELGGDAENQGEALGNLALYLPLIFLATIATLILSFRSVCIALLLLLVAGLSAGYGLFATWVWHLPLSFNTIIGTLGLIGLAFNSSIIVLASIYNNPAARQGDPEALRQAVARTGRHLAATTLTTMGSFLPILVLVGGQFWPPLAVVLAGGVGGSTLLAWTFTPAVYALLSKWRELRRTKTQTAPAAEINPLMAAV
jgi:multidrug efflux pump subunit AcrB